MRVGIAADHAGFGLKEQLTKALREGRAPSPGLRPVQFDSGR